MAQGNDFARPMDSHAWLTMLLSEIGPFPYSGRSGRMRCNNASAGAKSYPAAWLDN